jgi:chorismate mutase
MQSKNLNILQNLRNEIDSIDLSIIELLEKRFNIVSKVKEYKDSSNINGLYVRPYREGKMIKDLLLKTDNLHIKKLIFNIWRNLITESLSSEQNIEYYLPVDMKMEDFYWFSLYFPSAKHGYYENSNKGLDAICKSFKKENIIAIVNIEDAFYISQKTEAKIFAKIGTDFYAMGILQENDFEENYNDSNIMTVSYEGTIVEKFYFEKNDSVIGWFYRMNFGY